MGNSDIDYEALKDPKRVHEESNKYQAQVARQDNEELYVNMLLRSRITCEDCAAKLMETIRDKIMQEESVTEEVKRWADLSTIIEAYTKALRGF